MNGKTMRQFIFALLALCCAGKICSDPPQYAVELVLVQDATASFSDDFAQIRDHELENIRKILSRYEGSRYGVVSFRDKPLAPYGWPSTDYCVKYESALTEDFSVIEGIYSTLKSTGGGDERENSLGALLSAAQSDHVGWKPAGTAPGGGDYIRIIILITDAQPHEQSEKNTLGLPPHSGLEDSLDRFQCATYWYPTAVQVGSAVKARGAYLLSLIQGPSKNMAAWQWFNDQIMHQPADFVQPMASDSSTLSAVLDELMHLIDHIECPEVSTTPKPQTTSSVPTTCPAVPPRMPATCIPFFINLISSSQHQKHV